ncbi:hypothetical protein [Cupriavidus sp. UME77]|uniref:hypothetical protein n=1 Tax=Cupriavidus sp. UME77 TaxID=1862321 RepID=UPI00160003D0|nr:hypothetical protein [Cupriavidus sp. UME77]MBB1630310.1 hypothetical protein [Cupriavidus sp. UME77]
MADLSDASRALVALIAQTAYPAGTGQPSISGQAIKVYAGWPNPAQLADDMAAGKVHVSVFPRAVKPVDNAISKWRTITPPAHTVTLAVAGQAVTLGGAMSTPQNLVVFVEAVPYVYSAQPGDTLASAATALATLIAADYPGTTSSGQVITIAGTLVTTNDGVNVVLADGTPVYIQGPVPPVFCRVGGAAIRLREVRRQDQEFLITVWANCYDARDPLAGAIDSALAGINRITLPDGSFGTLRSRALSNSWDDRGQKERIYRRDLACWIEYSTTVQAQQYEVTQGQVVVENDAPAVIKTIYI